MENEKVSIENLKDVSETLLFPLLCRSYESKQDNGIINDQKSIEIMDRIEGDFSSTKLYTISRIGICLRTIILDDEVNKFLKRNPDATIVNLGCGLDTRYIRIDNGELSWYEIDLPGIIDLRKNFFKEDNRYKFIPGSVLDEFWIKKIPKNRPVLFIAEGLCFYFSEDENKKLLKMIKYNFPGAEFLMESFHPLYIKSVNKKKYDDPIIDRATLLLRWGIKSGKELESWFDEIEFIKDRYVITEDIKKYPIIIRILFNFMPFLKKTTKITHLRFRD